VRSSVLTFFSPRWVVLNEIKGLPGELIERLVTLIDSDDFGPSASWHQQADYLVFAVGGEDLQAVTPDTGNTYEPGTIGAVHLATHEVLSRADFFGVLRERLAVLVNAGLREDFLVRSLRDELRRQLRTFVPDEASAWRRQQTKEHLERSAENLSVVDTELAERLRRMACKFSPVPLEEERDAWLDMDRWDERAEGLLSNIVIEEWFRRYGDRVIRESGY
jgi:hypothetical protein